MQKVINFRLDKAKLTVINGENTICKNKSISGLEKITVDTNLQTTIKIKPNLFCDFNSTPSLKFSWVGNPTPIYEDIFTKNNNEYELNTNFQYDSFVINDNILINLTSYATEIYGFLQLNLTNCECNYSAGNLIAESTTFIITCDNNKKFQEIPYIEYGLNIVNSEKYSDYLTKIDDFTYSITLTIKKSYVYTITAEAVKNSSIIDKYGLISAYRLNNEELKLLATKRYVKAEYKPVEIDGTTVIYNINYDYVDTAKFIVALHKLNLSISTTEKQRVKFGPYDMDIDCDIIEDDLIMLNFGDIHIQGIYNNAIDFEHTNINIYLPFIGFISLDTAECMNKTITLKYQVNILNGDSIALIYADNNLIISQSCNIAIKIPYKMSDNEEINTQLDINNNYLVNEQPFIITRTNTAIQDDLLPYHDTHFYSILGDLSGYTEATEIKFNVVHDFITNSEIDEIKNLINHGVIL